jgi:hypothetical protein
MDTTKTDQMADDLHLLAAPLRLIQAALVAALFIAAYPLILAGMLYSAHIDALHEAYNRTHLYGYAPADWSIYKIVICVLGPFAFCAWFSLVTRWLERRRNERNGTDHNGINARACLGWLLSVIGAIAAVWLCAANGIEGEASVWLVCLGHLIPVPLYVLVRLHNSVSEELPVGDPDPTRRKIGGYWYYMTKDTQGRRWWHNELCPSDPFLDERDVAKA